jgi:group I intron endonuclease
MGCIYQAKNIVNGKCYIGKTVKSLTRRANRHKDDAKAGSGACFHRALIKYGLESFQWDVLYQSGDEKKLFEMEIMFIRLLNTMTPNGYNLTAGGQGMSGHLPSQETRVKLHNAQLGNTKGSGKKSSEEKKAKISAANFGKKRSKETKRKLSLVHTGRIVGPPSEETKRKISEANKGKKRPAESVKRIWELRHLHGTDKRTKESIIRGLETKRLRLVA